MQFAENQSRNFPPRRERPIWMALLLGAAVIGGVTAVQPWVKVHFARLWGELLGPPGWQSTPGFTLLCSSAMLAVMALTETATRATRQAVRPASVLLAAITVVALILHAGRGPGTLRSLTATWTWSFYFGGLAAMTLLATCIVRVQLLNGRRTARDPGQRPPSSQDLAPPAEPSDARP